MEDITLQLHLNPERLSFLHAQRKAQSDARAAMYQMRVEANRQTIQIRNEALAHVADMTAQWAQQGYQTDMSEALNSIAQLKRMFDLNELPLPQSIDEGGALAAFQQAIALAHHSGYGVAVLPQPGHQVCVQARHAGLLIEITCGPGYPDAAPIVFYTPEGAGSKSEFLLTDWTPDSPLIAIVERVEARAAAGG